MKNLFSKSRITFYLLAVIGLFSSTFVIAQNSVFQHCTITATGTGKTTGNVVALTIYNPSDKEVKGSLGPFFIPSDGGYQPYITLKETVTVPGGQTIKVDLKGFCADITKPPASEKDHFRVIDMAITNDTARMNIPPFPLVPNPDTNPKEAAPALLKAIEEIGSTYDKLKTEGKITTPFSAAPEKEREAVIQQTFWIYTSNLRQKPYTKEQFSTRTYEQYEEMMKIKPITLPADKKKELDKGIDDFWNTFQLVGTQAKVL